MSLEDPFFVVRDEVVKALRKSEDLYSRWKELVKAGNSLSKEEFDWTTNELRNGLRSIEWDLEDLDETIGIVEKNPKKFRISEHEVFERKKFINQTRQKIKAMRDHIANPGSRSQEERPLKLSNHANGPSRPQDKYQRLDNEIERDNSKFINDMSQQQQTMIKSQDSQLEAVGGTVTVLKNMSHQIGNELDEQAIMLDDFAVEMDQTESKLDATMKKMAKVLHMSNDKRQWCAIGVLIVVLIIIIILFAVI